MMNLLPSLEQYFGFDVFREGQEQAISQVIEGKSTLAIFPTGSGKSLCYQLSAMHLPHLTLVVSPLLALMKDQLMFLAKQGISAASIDSTLSAEQHQGVIAGVKSGDIKILMISVERFKNERFRQFISSIPISQLVVDEAHCISEWGHNFRPDYLKLPVYCSELNIHQVLLLTATANENVKQDMARKFAIKPEHIVQTGFYRNNLDLSVISVNEKDKGKELIEFIHHQQGAGIVYVTLQHTAETVAAYLKSQGINAEAYHAGFIDDKRQQIQHRFMEGKTQVMVATIAFGMGIDKSDIRFVVHYDLPKSIENYSQEIGRAGRDNQLSHCLTLANLDSLHTLENFVYGDTPSFHGIELLINYLKKHTEYGQCELQMHSLSTETNIRQLPLKTLLVQLELTGVLTSQYSYFADFKYKFLVEKEKVLQQFRGERRTFLESIFKHTQFKKVWGEPNFTSLFQDYSCERSRVVTALDYLYEKNFIELATKKMTEVYKVSLDKLNNDNLIKDMFNYCSANENSEIERIASLVKFFELNTCLTRNLSLYFGDLGAPQHCNHCSVCRGSIAQLNYSNQLVWPSDEELINACNRLANHLPNSQMNISLYCQFLVGLTVPIFTRKKVKQLAGFSSCQSLKYSDVKNKLISLSVT